MTVSAGRWAPALGPPVRLSDRCCYSPYDQNVITAIQEKLALIWGQFGLIQDFLSRSTSPTGKPVIVFSNQGSDHIQVLFVFLSRLGTIISGHSVLLFEIISR